jgi:hypothetical protein
MRTTTWAVVVVCGMASGSAAEGQTSNRMALWQTWNQKYAALEAARDCKGSELVYLEGYKYSIAYFYYRIATDPAPTREEGRQLAATLAKAENGIRSCLQVGPSSGAAGREGALDTAGDPPAIQKFFGSISAAISGKPTSGVSEMVELPPKRLEPPPGDVRPGADPGELFRLQNEIDQLRQNLGAANAATANALNTNNALRAEVAQLQGYVGELTKVASSPEGLWKVTISMAGQTESQVIAIVQEPVGYSITVVDDEKSMKSLGQDARGRWIFTMEEGGQKVTMYLDLSGVMQTRQIYGEFQAPQGVVPFVGMKLGDPRIR